MVTTECKICQKEFKIYKYKIKLGLGKYCSPKCSTESQKNKIKRNCIICDSEFYTVNSRIEKGRGKYCSRACYGKSKKVNMIGENNTKWRGGRHVIHGYVKIFSPDHPHKSATKYVQEHRLVVEKHIGRYLLPTEKVHHVNEIKHDNRIENLMVFNSISAHQRFHFYEDRVKKEEIVFDGRTL